MILKNYVNTFSPNALVKDEVENKTNFLKTTVLLVFILLSWNAIWGQTTTYTFSSAAWAASPANWTSKLNGLAFLTGRGIQVSTGTSGACGNSPISFTNVTSVRVGYSTNASAGAGTINVFSVASSTANAQSGTRIGTSTAVTTSGGTTTRYLTFNTSAVTGNIQIYVTCTTNSIYITSVDITTSSGSITGAATATAFTTTYGTASTAQTFPVSGSNLTANLVATAPTGFEVSADGTTYGATATFTQTSGSASGTLSVRLKANAPVLGSYNSQNIVLSSTGATSVNISTAASGNNVSTKALTITANDRNKVYGTALTLGASAFTLNGIANSETVGSVSLTAAEAASTAASVGTYSIVPSNASGGSFTASNYSITYTNGTLTISKADQTITFNSLSSKTYGDVSFDLTGTASSGLGLTYTSSDLNVATVSGNTLTIVGAGTTTITASQAGNANYNEASNVNQNLTVNAKDLTITGLSADDKIYDGTTSATLSGTPSLFGVINSDDVSVTGTPTAVFASSNVGQNITVNVNGYSLNGTKASNYALTQPTLSADIIATTPTLFTSGTLNALSTTYGTASSTTSFSVSGQSLTEGILVTAPTGFEVSSGGAYGSSITIGGEGIIASTTIMVRISATTSVGSYSGNIVLSSNGATSLNVATVLSTVTAKGLTISGLTGVDKVYDGTSSASVTGLPTLVGIANGDDVSLSGTPVYVFSNATVGVNKSIIASGFILSGTASGNYTLAQPTSLTATITKSNQTITSITATVSKTFGDGTYSVATTSDSGLTVAYASSNPLVATVATNGTVTIVGAGTTTITASQAGDTNYNAATSVTQVLTVGKADQTITAITATVAKTFGDATYSVATTSSSGLTVTYSSSNTAVATVAANGIVTIVGAGLTTITASQTGNANYNAATSVTQVLTVGKADQTITLDATAAKTTADGSYTLPLNASSGLAIAYSSSNTAVATVSGNTVTIVGVGTAIITANQEGSANYNAATQAIQTLTVILAPVVIANWNFNTTSPSSNNSNVTVNALTQGNNNGTTTLLNSSSASSGYSGASGGNNAGAAARIGALNTAANGSAYFEFTLSPASNFETTITNLSLGSRSTTTGPQSVTLRWSKDNYQTDLFVSNVATGSWQFLVNTNSLSGIVFNENITFRIYGYNGTGSASQNTANWRIDDLILRGFVNPLQPTITSSLSTVGTVGSSFSYNIVATGQVASYAATGLPDGLSINTSTGVISGTPTESGTFNVSISATNVVGTDVETLELIIIPVTTINASQCGGTINYFDRVYPISVPGASGYAFDIYAADGTTFITTIENTYRFFRFTQLNFTLGATYQIRVRVKVGNVYGIAGSACSITIGNSLPSTTLETAQCGGTINYSARVYPIGVEGATGYAFDIYAADGTTFITTIENTYSFFRFTQIDFTLGATYQVRVRVKRGNVYGLAGTPCSVTIANSLPTTTLETAQCGGTINYSARVYPIGVEGATGYAFDIYAADGTTFITTIENTFSFFRFTQINFTLGATYQVRVRVKRGNVYGLAGTPCSVTIANSLPTTTLETAQCGASINFADRVYPIGVEGATGYAFDIYSADGTTLITTIENTYNFFRFTQINFTLGATYQVRVRVKRGSVYGLAGTACSIAIRNELPTTRLETSQCGVTINYTDRVYPIGVEGATGYAFDIYGLDGVTLIATIENSNSFFRFTQINYVLGEKYYVRVRVKRGDQYGAQGDACLVQLNDPNARVEVVVKEDESSNAITNGNLKAYPNPFTSTFNITPIEGETETLFYQVYDVTGKMIESRSVEASEVAQHAIGEYYPTGMYLIIARQGAMTQTFKMVKQ